MSDPQTEASIALAETFHGDYGRLPEAQRAALVADVLDLQQVDHLATVHAAARELQRRLRPATLASYARSITAQVRR